MGIPRKELVGQNAGLVNGVYCDDYTAALNRFASVDEVFGENREAIARGEQGTVARLTMGTLGKSEYEAHLAALVMTAANAGEWRAVERGPQHMSGLEEVTRKHFGHVTEYQGQTFLLPSAMYLVYCNDQR
ncbi:hypothetical protein HYV82_02565 [Candidatus Woesearchaeota archaeon]|nr:hypothetical protein [Candidatus Woesearchaeota archaeon]